MPFRGKKSKTKEDKCRKSLNPIIYSKRKPLSVEGNRDWLLITAFFEDRYLAKIIPKK
jgi:hypothetical protein